MNHILKTTDGDLRWGWKVLILIAGTILFGGILNTLLMIALTMLASSQGLAQGQAMEQASNVSGEFIPQVVLSVLQLGFMVFLVRWLVVKVEKQPFDLVQLGLAKIQRAKDLVLGIALALGLSLLTIGLGLATGSLKYLGLGFDLFGSNQVFCTLLLAAVLAIASGFGEELAFRGYLQSRIARRYSPWLAVVIVAALFALSHPPTGVNPWLYLVNATLAGMLFGISFLRTGSLWMGATLHAFWNYLQIAVLAVRNSADERFFGSPLLVFDNRIGAQHMLIETVVLALGLIIIFAITKNAERSMAGTTTTP